MLQDDNEEGNTIITKKDEKGDRECELDQKDNVYETLNGNEEGFDKIAYARSSLRIF